MIIKRMFVDEWEQWEEISKEECIRVTEENGYWKPGTINEFFKNGFEATIRTPCAYFKFIKEIA